MLRKIIFFAVTSGLAARAFRHFRQQRDGIGAPPAKAAVRVWENEGGSLKPSPADR